MEHQDKIKQGIALVQQEIDKIIEKIGTGSEKVIPILEYIPQEILSYTKSVWWIAPFCIWKDEIASLVFADKNGIHAIYPDDNDITQVASWDAIVDIDFDEYYSDDPNVNQLFIDFGDDVGHLTFEEFVDDTRGSYLSVLHSIYLIFRDTITASKDSPLWKVGVGGEGFKNFKTPQDLLNYKKWEDPHTPDPASFGYMDESQPEETIIEEKSEKKLDLPDEIIAEVFKDGANYQAKIKDTETDITDLIDNPAKLKYAFERSGLVRGKKDKNGNYIWRVMR